MGTGPRAVSAQRYATQGGLEDDFIAAAGVEVEHIHDDAIAAVDELNKYTHVREGTIVSDQAGAACRSGRWS